MTFFYFVEYESLNNFAKNTSAVFQKLLELRTAINANTN